MPSGVLSTATICNYSFRNYKIHEGMDGTVTKVRKHTKGYKMECSEAEFKILSYLGNVKGNGYQIWLIYIEIRIIFSYRLSLSSSIFGENVSKYLMGNMFYISQNKLNSLKTRFNSLKQKMIIVSKL